ncbi:MAG: hypothetical protein GXP47_12300 [Acidobacteria bacterium]|nr:hypothetical protein [Acidobacteriota bacterium]
MPAVCFDLEGPLSPQDNAYEVMGLFENGYRIFEVISRYDDVIALEGREDYEPGDTLKLIVPFLLYHGVTEDDIARVSSGAALVDGVGETVRRLKEWGFEVHVISTSYSQHAHTIASRIGIGPGDVACTRLPLDEFRQEIGPGDLALVEEMERQIPGLLGADDDTLKAVLDGFFFERLDGTPLGDIMDRVRVVGGSRKVEALEGFIRSDGLAMDEVVAVGDSITDYKMLQRVRDGGGLAVVFNGNEYSLPHGDVALAALDMRCILPLIEAFKAGGKEAALEAARGLSDGPAQEGHPPRYHLIQPGAEREILEIHREFRRLVRGRAGELG